MIDLETKWLSGTFLVLPDRVNNWNFRDVLMEKCDNL